MNTRSSSRSLALTIGALALTYLPAALASATPSITAPQLVPAVPGETVTVSIDLSGAEASNVFLANFLMGWDEDCLELDPVTDSDNDGLADTLSSRNPSPVLFADATIANPENNPIALTIHSGNFATTGPQLLLDGNAFDIEFTVVCEPEPGESVRVTPITIAPQVVPRFPTLDNVSVPASFISGSVAIGGGEPEPEPEPMDLLAFADEAYSTVFSALSVATAWIRNGDFAVIQAANANPSMAFADIPVLDRRISFEAEVSNVHDNDAFGVAIGYRGGDVTNPDADYLLVDWKKSPEGPIPALSIDGEVVGLRLSQVTGTPDLVELFDHSRLVQAPFDSASGVDELDVGAFLGDVGWQAQTPYTFTLEVRADSLRVFVDGELEIDYVGPVPTEGFAFYNGSLPGTEYRNLVVEAL